MGAKINVVINTNVMPAKAGTQVTFRQGTVAAPGQRALAARRARGGRPTPCWTCTGSRPSPG